MRILEKLCYILLIFFVGSFVGKVVETIIYLTTKHKLINTGSMFGPWIPIYGIGAVILYFLHPLKNKPLYLFLSAALLSGVLEYFTGLFLDKVLHKPMWDYSGMFLNIQGYVCLLGVVSFGIGGLILNYGFLPFFDRVFNTINFKYTKYLTLSLTLIFIADFIISKMYKNLPLS